MNLRRKKEKKYFIMDLSRCERFVPMNTFNSVSTVNGPMRRYSSPPTFFDDISKWNGKKNYLKKEEKKVRGYINNKYGQGHF
jgi:hypothetical protein